MLDDIKFHAVIEGEHEHLFAVSNEAPGSSSRMLLSLSVRHWSTSTM